MSVFPADHIHQRKILSIVRMPAEKKVCARLRGFPKPVRIVIEDDPDSVLSMLREKAPDRRTVRHMGSVPPQQDAMRQHRALVSQKPNARLGEKTPERRVGRIRIMIARHRVHTVPGSHARQYAGCPVRVPALIHSAVIDQIACEHDQIRPQRVHPLHHAAQIPFPDDRADVKVAELHDTVRLSFVEGSGRDAVRPDSDGPGVDHAARRDAEGQAGCGHRRHGFQCPVPARRRHTEFHDPNRNQDSQIIDQKRDHDAGDPDRPAVRSGIRVRSRKIRIALKEQRGREQKAQSRA